MTIERPTSVSVVSWFFIIIGSLSVLSAIGYIVVSIINGISIAGAWPGFVQVLVAGFLVYGGVGLLRGSELMRKALEIVSYTLAIAILAYSVSVARDLSSLVPLFGFAMYIIPLAFVVRSLRSEKVKAYASKT